jgi:hypothetical protein
VDPYIEGKMFQGIKIKHVLMSILRRIRGWFVRDHVFVLGDSHAAVFYDWQFDLRFPNLVFFVTSVNGATASGLENPNSATQAYKVFENVLARRHPAKRYVLLLGEVDTGFVIWHRAQKNGAPVDEMLTQALDRYSRFIMKVKVLGDVTVVSAPLPTIPDKSSCGEIANLRKEVKASQYERTHLTLTFNQRVRNFCDANGVHFLNLDCDSLGSDGLVKKELLHSNPCNHHYDVERYAQLLTQRLLDLW